LYRDAIGKRARIKHWSLGKGLVLGNGEVEEDYDVNDEMVG